MVKYCFGEAQIDNTSSACKLSYLMRGIAWQLRRDRNASRLMGSVFGTHYAQRGKVTVYIGYLFKMEFTQKMNYSKYPPTGYRHNVCGVYPVK